MAEILDFSTEVIKLAFKKAIKKIQNEDFRFQFNLSVIKEKQIGTVYQVEILERGKDARTVKYPKFVIEQGIMLEGYSYEEALYVVLYDTALHPEMQLSTKDEAIADGEPSDIEFEDDCSYPFKEFLKDMSEALSEISGEIPGIEFRLGKISKSAFDFLVVEVQRDLKVLGVLEFARYDFVVDMLHSQNAGESKTYKDLVKECLIEGIKELEESK